MSERYSLKTLAVSLATLAFIGAAGLEAGLPQVKFAARPSQAVLVVIDGLSYKTWDKMELPVLDEMASSGTLIKQVFLPPAAHPHEGPYAKLHTCSIPNPILMAGTIFIDEKTVYFNEQFFPKLTAAFAVTKRLASSSTGVSGVTTGGAGSTRGAIGSSVPWPPSSR